MICQKYSLKNIFSINVIEILYHMVKLYPRRNSSSRLSTSYSLVTQLIVGERNFHGKSCRLYLQVFAMDYLAGMIFTFPPFHLNSTNWSLGAEHTGQTSGQTPSDT
jgi:hypothetical protein